MHFFYKNTRLTFAQNLRTNIMNNASLSSKKEIKNKRKRINFKSKKKLNTVLIQNDKILVICQYLLAKLLRF